MRWFGQEANIRSVKELMHAGSTLASRRRRLARDEERGDLSIDAFGGRTELVRSPRQLVVHLHPQGKDRKSASDTSSNTRYG